ncbi:hypothetical protein D3C72_1993670 [compost metagenome]
MKPFNPVIRNRLLNDLLQMQMVGKTLVRVALFFSKSKAAVFKPLQHVAGLAVQFIEKHVVEQWAVRRDDKPQVRLA